MENLNNAQSELVFNFLSNLKTEVCITDYVNIEDIDIENAYDSIFEKIQDNRGFDIEIIYYGSAMKYLSENDPSLRESLEIAHEYGYTADKINSELLASLLASRNAVEEFYELRDEIENFFSELSEELETEEEND